MRMSQTNNQDRDRTTSFSGSGEVGGTIPFAGMDNLAPFLVSPSDGPER